MSANTTISVAALVSIISVLISLYGFFTNRKKDTQQEDAKTEEIRTSILKANMKLDTVCASLTGIAADIKGLDKRQTELDKAVLLMRHDLDALAERVDRMEDDTK